MTVVRRIATVYAVLPIAIPVFIFFLLVTLPYFYMTEENKETQNDLNPEEVEQSELPEGVRVLSTTVVERRLITFEGSRFREILDWTWDNGWNVAKLGPFNLDKVDAASETLEGDPEDVQTWMIEKKISAND